MAKKLPTYLKEGRKLVKGWAKRMRPYAEKHLNQDWVGRGEKGLVENCWGGGLEVYFENLQGFYMGAKAGGDHSEFSYARQVALHDPKTEYDKDMTLAAKLGAPIFDCANAAGFRTRLVSSGECVVSCGAPTIFFFGKGGEDKFEDYIRLVDMAETFLDFQLDDIMDKMPRPHKYLIVPNSRMSGWVSWIYPTKDIDFNKVLGVLETRKPIKGVEGKMGYPDANSLLLHHDKKYGKLISVDEYLGAVVCREGVS